MKRIPCNFKENITQFFKNFHSILKKMSPHFKESFTEYSKEFHLYTGTSELTIRPHVGHRLVASESQVDDKLVTTQSQVLVHLTCVTNK